VRCQDNGQISWATCVPANTCRRRRDSITQHIVDDDPTMPAVEMVSHFAFCPPAVFLPKDRSALALCGVLPIFLAAENIALTRGASAK